MSKRQESHNIFYYGEVHKALEGIRDSDISKQSAVEIMNMTVNDTGVLKVMKNYLESPIIKSSFTNKLFNGDYKVNEPILFIRNTEYDFYLMFTKHHVVSVDKKNNMYRDVLAYSNERIVSKNSNVSPFIPNHIFIKHVETDDTLENFGSGMISVIHYTNKGILSNKENHFADYRMPIKDMAEITIDLYKVYERTKDEVVVETRQASYETGIFFKDTHYYTVTEHIRVVKHFYEPEFLVNVSKDIVLSLYKKSPSAPYHRFYIDSLEIERLYISYKASLTSTEVSPLAEYTNALAKAGPRTINASNRPPSAYDSQEVKTLRNLRNHARTLQGKIIAVMRGYKYPTTKKKYYLRNHPIDFAGEIMDASYGAPYYKGIAFSSTVPLEISNRGMFEDEGVEPSNRMLGAKELEIGGPRKKRDTRAPKTEEDLQEWEDDLIAREEKLKQDREALELEKSKFANKETELAAKEKDILEREKKLKEDEAKLKEDREQLEKAAKDFEEMDALFQKQKLEMDEKFDKMQQELDGEAIFLDQREKELDEREKSMGIATPPALPEDSDIVFTGVLSYGEMLYFLEHQRDIIDVESFQGRLCIAVKDTLYFSKSLELKDFSIGPNAADGFYFKPSLLDEAQPLIRKLFPAKGLYVFCNEGILLSGGMSALTGTNFNDLIKVTTNKPTQQYALIENILYFIDINGFIKATIPKITNGILEYEVSGIEAYRSVKDDYIYVSGCTIEENPMLITTNRKGEVRIYDHIKDKLFRKVSIGLNVINEKDKSIYPINSYRNNLFIGENIFIQTKNNMPHSHVTLNKPYMIDMQNGLYENDFAQTYKKLTSLITNLEGRAIKEVSVNGFEIQNQPFQPKLNDENVFIFEGSLPIREITINIETYETEDPVEIKGINTFFS